MRWLLICGLLFVAGCGTETNFKTASEIADRSANMGGFEGDQKPAALPPARNLAPESTVQTTDDAQVDRKIIYTARLDIVVKNFDGIERQVQETVEDHGGYLSSNSDATSTAAEAESS